MELWARVYSGMVSGLVTPLALYLDCRYYMRLGRYVCTFYVYQEEWPLVIDRVHDVGQLEPKQTPGMIVTSLISITAAGSLGARGFPDEDQR